MANDETTSSDSKESSEPKKGMPGGSGGKGQSGTDAGKTDKGEANDKYGYVTHLVNPAGYLLVGAVEETS